MGLWHQGTHRKLRPYEFRIEVIFETPVLFVAPPTNERGPVKKQPIHYINGTDESYQNTRTIKPDDQKKLDESATRVHTVHDEKASWLELLQALQGQEAESRRWDEQQRNAAPLPPTAGVPEKPPKSPSYQLEVGVQSKTRSWDFMPSSITRPYATSAICHLVEIVAMLGMYWKVFDQERWYLRAEGNGYILTSGTIHGLGVMVTFSRTGSSSFKEKRLIPSDAAVKKLTFGNVPHILNGEAYLKEESAAQTIPLVFGTDEEVETTLEALGCQADTLKKYRKDHKHVFSVSFEILGMLAEVFRIRGSSFKMIPNPTADHWLKNVGHKASWTITSLMRVFQKNLQRLDEIEAFSETHPVKLIMRQWEAISELGCTDENNLSIYCREAIHDAIDHRTAFLLSLPQAQVLEVLVAHITTVVDTLEDQTSSLNTIALARNDKEQILINFYFREIRPSVIGIVDTEKNYTEAKPMSDAQDQKNTIWVSLVFRMLCWYLLHDFNKSDAKIVPSDLEGSRMPIFIG